MDDVVTVDEWRSCVMMWSQWMNGGVVWMMWSQFTVDEWRSCVNDVVTVDEWRSCVDDVVTAHSG